MLKNEESNKKQHYYKDGQQDHVTILFVSLLYFQTHKQVNSKALYIEVRYWLCPPARVWYYSLALSNFPPNKLKVLKEELGYLRMWNQIKSNTITRIGSKIMPPSFMFFSFIFQHTDMWICKGEYHIL